MDLTCQAAFELTREEKTSYVDCVDRQMDRCDRAFATSLAEEVEATNSQLEANAVFLADATHTQEACQGAFGTAQAAVAAWLTSGIDYRLHYTCDGDAAADGACNATACDYDEAKAKAEADADASLADDATPTSSTSSSSSSSFSPSSCTCAEVSAMVGDRSALRTAAFATGVEYSESSQSTVSSMANFASERAAYDASYAYNHSEP